jgi:hypothetical protein
VKHGKKQEDVMLSDRPKIAVLAADDRLAVAVKLANRELGAPADVITLTPSDRDVDVDNNLVNADVVIADLQIFPLMGISRSRLYEVLRRKPALFLYPADQLLTYERTREAFRSGARDLLPMPKRPREFAEYLNAVLPHSPRPAAAFRA